MNQTPARSASSPACNQGATSRHARSRSLLFHHLGNRNQFGRHSRVAMSRRNIPRHACSLRHSARQHRGPRGRTNRSRCVELSKPHATTRQIIQRRSNQILRPVAVHVDRTLIIGVNQDDVRRQSICIVREHPQTSNNQSHDRKTVPHWAINQASHKSQTSGCEFDNGQVVCCG